MMKQNLRLTLITALAYCINKELYQAIDSRAKKQEFTPEQLFEVRQNEARPIFDEIKIALMDYQGQVLPKNPMGKAITYALNQWEALNRSGGFSWPVV